jgi:hypothetical protein
LWPASWAVNVVLIVDAKRGFARLGVGDERGGDVCIQVPDLGGNALDIAGPAVARGELAVREELDVKALGQGAGRIAARGRGQGHDQDGRRVGYRGVIRVAHVRHASGGEGVRER